MRGEFLLVVWPIGRRDPEDARCWPAACVALVIPLTALLHHLVFYHHLCMLQFFGSDYDFQTVKGLFLRDPSLPWAIAAMVLVYHLGKSSPALRTAAVPAFTALIPVSLWIWDIPFAHRPIHIYLHDAKVPFGTTHVYALSLVMYLIFEAILFFRRRPQEEVGGPRSGDSLRRL